MAKLGRPFTYQSEEERPVTVSLRIPRDLAEQMKRYAARLTEVRPKTAPKHDRSEGSHAAKRLALGRIIFLTHVGNWGIIPHICCLL